MRENDDFMPEGSFYDAKKDGAPQAAPEGKQGSNSMDGAFPILITALFLLFGVFLNAWHPAWMLFFTIPLYYWQEDSLLERLFNPIVITVLYLILGFYFNLWHPGWLIFLAIPLRYTLLEEPIKKERARQG